MTAESDATVADLLADMERYLTATHEVAGRHDSMGDGFGCAGCELRKQVAGALRELAEAGE